jgi:hypothetical protein
MWLEVGKAVLSTMAVALATFGFGTWLLFFFPETFSKFSRYVCSWVAGFGIFGLTIFVVGLWSLTRLRVGVLIGIGVASALVHVWQKRDSLASFLRSWSKPPAIPLLIVVFVMGLTAIAGLAEPVGDWGVDGVAYHFVGPKVWLRDGVIRPIADNAPTSYPCEGEMIFAAVLPFGGERAMGFSAVLSIALFLLMVACVALRCGLDSSGAWWAAATVLTMGAVYQGSHTGFIDAVYATFILAAARIGFDATNKTHFAAFGLFCGLAMATKYPGLLALPVLLLCAAWTEEGFLNTENLKRICISGMWACLIASPIYLKNWFFLGSPIYPPPAAATHFLHVKYYSADTARAFYAFAADRGRGPGRGILRFFLLPFNLTYHTAEFYGAGGIGLAPLAFGPLGIFAGWQNHFSRRLAAAAALLTIVWYATMQESRYLIHVFAISAIFAVMGWRYASSLLGKRGTRLGAFVFGISVLYGLVMISSACSQDIHSVISRSFAQQRRHSQVPFVESFDYLNHAPSVTRLLILDRSVMAYYSDKDYVKPFGQWGELLIPDATTAKDILGKLSELKISHILDVRSNISDFQVPPEYRGLVLVFDQPNQRIYKMVSP